MDSKVILLVEDNQDDIILTQRALLKSNVLNKLVVVTDGEAAVRYLFGDPQNGGRNPGELPVLILLDLKLPKVDGLKLLRLIRSNKRTSLLPVVILTSSREESDLTTGYKLGANSYIRKPVDFNQFAEAIRQLGLYWLVLNESPPFSAKPH
jgi:two-component system, response regulator